jgi:hypothetical protein
VRGGAASLFRGMSTGTCACARHDAVEWIRVGFGDCVSGGTDFAGFVFGMMSICCWLVAQVPQFVQNFRSGSAEGLSPWFLAEWLLGDTFNLLGCLMTGDQLASETYTAGYFMCVVRISHFPRSASLFTAPDGRAAVHPKRCSAAVLLDCTVRT